MKPNPIDNRFLIGLRESLNVIMFVSGALMTLFVVVQVIARYLFHSPLSWTEEFSRIMFFWITFVGAAIALRTDQHITVTAFVNILPARIRLLINIIVRLLTIPFVIIVSYGGIKISWSMKASSTPALRISLAWFYVPVAIGGIFLTFYAIFKLIDVIYSSRGDSA